MNPYQIKTQCHTFENVICIFSFILKVWRHCTLVNSSVCVCISVTISVTIDVVGVGVVVVVVVVVVDGATVTTSN